MPHDGLCHVLQVLLAARPGLLDTAHTLDLVLSCDTPTPLPQDGPPALDRPRLSQPPPPAADDKGSDPPPALDPAAAAPPALPAAAKPPSLRRRGLWMVPYGAPGAKPCPSPDEPPADPQTPAATASKVPAAAAAAAPAPTDPPPPARSATQALLDLVAARLGLGALQIPWAHPDTVRALFGAPPSAEGDGADPEQQEAQGEEGEQEAAGLVLDMRRVEHVQLAMRLCRWFDMSRDELDGESSAALQGAVTDAGDLALEHQSTWAYWEQVRPQGCARGWWQGLQTVARVARKQRR